MALINLEKQDFNELTKEGLVLVDFYAMWCGPCKMIAPILEELSNEVDNTIVKVDVDRHPEISQQYNIMSIPTLVLFKNGQEVTRRSGFQTKDMLKAFIKENE